MDVQEMISDVARARANLIELASNTSVTPERLAKCEELVITAWVPKNSYELTASIVCVNHNLKRVQSDIAAALDVVLLECRPDEMYRVWCAMSFVELLKFELDVLMTALARVMKNQPQGHTWIN